ncbi:MAG: ArsR family transcriptional regulator [Nitrosopumilaceae archaeon]
MSTLLKKEIKINRILITNTEQGKALNDSARIKILQILYHNELTAEQISGELYKTGHKKAVTTIRHHLDILKNAGLIEIVKMEEARGAVMKYYGTSVKLLGYGIPQHFDSEYSNAILDVSVRIEKMIKNILQKNLLKIKKKNIEHLNDSHYNQYVLMEIINRAVTNIFENNSSDSLIIPDKKSKSVSKKD